MVVRMDLHCHTVYSKHWFWGSDALNTPAEMIKAAIKNGLNGLAITDHNNVQGALIGKKFARRYKNFVFIPGVEVRSASGDIVALGISENVPKYLPVEETVRKIHDLGGIAIAAHPFANYPLSHCLGKEAVKTDAVEVFNSYRRKEHNLKAVFFAHTNKKPITAGSDAHTIRNVGKAGIIFESDPLEEILKGKIRIFGDHTTKKDLAYLSIRKFGRSFKWKLGAKPKYS